MRTALALTLLATSASAQWQLHDAHTTADLRGIDNVGGGVAWASGTDGTILRTEDAGFVWQLCAKPPGGEHLDFRAVQAFDNNTAIIMSSGKGDLSRLYKTTDGCQTWKLVFTNPDEEGFFDALRTVQDGATYVLGDSVRSKFPLFVSRDRGNIWFGVGEEGRDSQPGDGAFAASNSSLISVGDFMFFGTGGNTGHPARVYRTFAQCVPPPDKPKAPPLDCTLMWTYSDTPLGTSGSTSGIYSLAGRIHRDATRRDQPLLLAVGGDYQRPDVSDGTAIHSEDGGEHWTAATTPPHGYRSAVAYDSTTKTWITVGPNGTDMSTDDGRNWRALKPDPKYNDTPDADQHWNALSLPYAVGPHGRIGTLRPSALQPAR